MATRRRAPLVLRLWTDVAIKNLAETHGPSDIVGCQVELESHASYSSVTGLRIESKRVNRLHQEYDAEIQETHEGGSGSGR